MPTQNAAAAKKTKRALRGKPQKPFFERLALDFKRNWILYLMALPALIYFIVYCYAPMAGLYIAVSDFKISGGLFDGKFVGLKYLMDFFHSYYFGRLLRNTLVLSLETLIFGFPIPILFALVLNEIRSRGFKKLAQTVTYMPHFISIVVICGLVVNFFSLNGLVNTIVQLFGGKPIAFMSDPKWFRTVYVGSEIWQNFGWDSVVFLAALAGIDLAQFEAAKLDGASRWQTIWHISLPSILPTVVTMLLMRLGHVMSLGFEKVFNLYSPATYETADIISTFVYRQGILGANFSSAAAIGLFNSVINLILVVVMNKVSRKLTESSLW